MKMMMMRREENELQREKPLGKVKTQKFTDGTERVNE